MPKYIRTEKGIYEASKTISVNFKECYIEAYDTQLERWVKKDIIKQADTIEELCDCFVQIISNGTIKQRSIFSDLHHLKIRKENYEIYNKVDTFGAIWTDKGLIYVAKMNEDGKLVLI